MEYKIKQLVEEGYDFKKLYPEKQEAVRQQTGLDFYLESIVMFLQKQTNNFTIDNPIAHDLDNAIYGIVQKYGKENGKEPMPMPLPKEEPMPLPQEEQSEAELIESFLYYKLDEEDKIVVDSMVFILDDKLKVLQEILDRELLLKENIPFVNQLIEEYQNS
jgi:hypothetical protein